MDLSKIIKQMEDSKAKVSALEDQLSAERAKGLELLKQFNEAVSGFQQSFGFVEPEKGKSGRPASKKTSESASGRVCGICGESGHNARTCPKKATS